MTSPHFDFNAYSLHGVWLHHVFPSFCLTASCMNFTQLWRNYILPCTDFTVIWHLRIFLFTVLFFFFELIMCCHVLTSCFDLFMCRHVLTSPCFDLITCCHVLTSPCFDLIMCCHVFTSPCFVPERRSGKSDVSPLCGISELPFDSTLLSPLLFFCLVLLLFLSWFCFVFCFFVRSGPFSRLEKNKYLPQKFFSIFC